MAYGIFDLELTEPLPNLSDGCGTGVAVILRRRGRVLGFLMKSPSGENSLDRDGLARCIAGEVGVRWVREVLREELGVRGEVGDLPNLTVAICTRDRPDCLRRCLGRGSTDRAVVQPPRIATKARPEPLLPPAV